MIFDVVCTVDGPRSVVSEGSSSHTSDPTSVTAQLSSSPLTYFSNDVPIALVLSRSFANSRDYPSYPRKLHRSCSQKKMLAQKDVPRRSAGHTSNAHNLTTSPTDQLPDALPGSAAVYELRRLIKRHSLHVS